MNRPAANDSEFWPPIFSNSEFRGWAIRTFNRLHMAAGCGDHAMNKIFMFEGVPPSDWVAGLVFVIEARLSNPKPSCVAL